MKIGMVVIALTVGFMILVLASISAVPWDAPSYPQSKNLTSESQDERCETIMQIQGAEHTSPCEGKTVSVNGIITVMGLGTFTIEGFFIQDTMGDGNDNTSDAVFVFTDRDIQEGVQVGDLVRVSGKVAEYQGLTQIVISEIHKDIQVLSESNSLPSPVKIGMGQGMRRPPREIHDDDGLTIFEPETDGMDFLESLEGMLIQLNDLVAVDTPVESYNAVWAVADEGAWVTGYLDRFGVAKISGGVDPSKESDDDFNPEVFEIDTDELRDKPFKLVDIDPGDHLGSYIGVLSYSFDDFLGYQVGGYEFLPIEKIDSNLTFDIRVDYESSFTHEVTEMASNSPSSLTLANFNVNHLDPSDISDKDFRLEPYLHNRISAVAESIVKNLRSPNIVALQEMQDNNGTCEDGTICPQDGIVDATESFDALIKAVQDAGGPLYEYYQINPLDQQDGGEPGGNSRVGYLYDPTKVRVLNGPFSGRVIDSDSLSFVSETDAIAYPGADSADAFAKSRKPLSLVFQHVETGAIFYVINVEFSVRSGENFLQGLTQPILTNEGQIDGQAVIVKQHVDAIIDEQPNANVIVTGNFNTFEFQNAMNILFGGSISDKVLVPFENRLLIKLEPSDPQDSFTFLFNGRAETRDHMLVTGNLVNALTGFDVVHIHGALARFGFQISEHDPLIVRFDLAGLANEE